MMEIVSDAKIFGEFEVISEHLDDWTDSKGKNIAGEVYSVANSFMSVSKSIEQLKMLAQDLFSLCEDAEQMGD